MTRHFLQDDDLSPAEQAEVLELATLLKAKPYSERPFEDPKTVALIFDKTSTRTRVSFAVGVADLGGVPLIIDSQGSQLGKKESVADTARVLERQVAAIVWRTYAHAGLEEMAANTTVPVINSLSDDYHPCQILADLLTVKEHKGALAGKTFAYLGDASNNMANSYLIGCATAGMHVRVAGPAGYQPAAGVVARAKAIAAETGGSVEVFTDPKLAIAGAGRPEGPNVTSGRRVSKDPVVGRVTDVQLLGGSSPDGKSRCRAAAPIDRPLTKIGPARIEVAILDEFGGVVVHHPR